jgi:hypothetical protein
VAIQKNKKHGVEHGDFNIQLHQRSQAIDRFSEVHGLGIEVDFFDFSVGVHHWWRAPEMNWEHSIRDQMAAMNVGLMEQLRFLSTLHDKEGY